MSCYQNISTFVKCEGLCTFRCERLCTTKNGYTLYVILCVQYMFTYLHECCEHRRRKVNVAQPIHDQSTLAFIV